MKIFLKKAVFLFFTVVILMLLGFISSNINSGFRGIHFNGMFQFIEPGRVHPNRQSLDVFYSNDYLIARDRLNVYSAKSSINPGSAQVSGGNLTLDTSYIYYICKRGEKFGLAFDSVSFRTGKPVPINVDSTIQSILGAPAFFYKLKSKGKDSVNIIRDDSKGLLLEKYAYRRREIQEPDSLYFYFTSQPLEISFNMKEQRKDKMQLYKMRAICNAAPKGTFLNTNFDVKKFEYMFELTETEVPMGEVSDLIQRFKMANQ
jgi:hypothetical protein